MLSNCRIDLNFKTASKCLIDPEVNDTLSLDDCISLQSDKIIKDFKPTNEKKIVEFKVIPRNEEAGLFIKTPDK